MNITARSNKVSARVINVNRVKNVKILRAQCYRESEDAGLRKVRQPAGGGAAAVRVRSSANQKELRVVRRRHRRALPIAQF